MAKAVTLDPYHEQIFQALDGHLDHEVFEQCAAELINQDGWSVVPVTGGQDEGFDGAVADGEEAPFSLIVTTGKDLCGNLRRNVQRQRLKGWKGDRALFATSQRITPTNRSNLNKTAQELEVTLLQVYDRVKFAYLLYRSPSWCKRLLGLTGMPRSLSVFPRTERPRLGDHVFGRDSEFQWLKKGQSDCLVVGGPGSGKTFLLQSLANKGKALFLVDEDREQLANDIRELQPSAVIIDDAHVKPDSIRTFDQLRKEIDAEHIRIIATCWTSGVAPVRSALRLADQNVLNLDLIDADTMVRIIRSFGLEGPDRLIAIIREQAAGRPGLAATLVDFCMKDNIKRVVSGEGLVDQLFSQLSQTLDIDVKRLLAPFALGGDAGVRQSEVARLLGLSEFETCCKLAHLATAGVIRESKNDALSVEPAQMRWVLVREVFFGGAGSLNYTSFLEIVENPIDAIATLIRASSIGAQIPNLLHLVENADFPNLWSEYAWLGPSEAEHALISRPELIEEEEIAQAGLHHLPTRAITQLLDRSGEASNVIYKDPIKHLEKWINDTYRARQDSQSVRATLVTTAHRWWKQTRQTMVATRAMCLALKPTFEYWTTDPGTGRTITATRGTLMCPLLNELTQLWPYVKEVIGDGEEVPFSELLSLINGWRLHLDPKVKLSDETETVKREFAECMLRDLAEATREYPGIQHRLQDSVEAMRLRIDLTLDPIFEAFYSWQDLVEEERQVGAVAKLLGIGDRPIEKIAESLARIWAEARRAEFDAGRSRVAEQICRIAADSSEDPVKAAEIFMQHSLPSNWIHPFLLRAATEKHNGWTALMNQFLTDGTYQSIAVSVVLTLLEPSPELLAASLALAKNTPSLIHDLCSCGRVPKATLEALLRGDARSGVPTAAAIGYWSAKQKGEMELVNESLWRRAIISSLYDQAFLNGHESYGYRLCKILVSDNDLAEQWLLTLIGQGHDGLRIHAEEIAVESVIPTMDLPQRRTLLRALPAQSNWIANKIVRHLVGQDLDLYQELLDVKTLSQYHLSPLVGKPDWAWGKKAALALEAGISVIDVVKATGIQTGSPWIGSESKMWADWRSAFQGLLKQNELAPRISQVARLGARMAGEREKDSLKQERYSAVFVS